MRPIYHPSAKEITVQGILFALSDPVRLRIYMGLLDAHCTQNCSTFLKVGEKPIPKSTLSQHFSILREAGLVRSVRKGVELQNEPRCEDLGKKFTPMIESIMAAYKKEL
jgi:DNA-binding transcriptional ArsR family regulator